MNPRPANASVVESTADLTADPTVDPMSELVSCLMVTRNRLDLARQAARCFAEQTWCNKELVIVDDGDQDYTPLVDELRAGGHAVRYHRIAAHPEVRLGGLRNLSLDLAGGEWCVQWDDDDWYHPDRIATQMAARGAATGVALQWTLVHVESPTLGMLAYRADTGIATPGTILHRRDAARYPNLARAEDGVFLRDVRRAGGLNVLGSAHSHLFVRRFHGHNTWDERHFLARLHRRPTDWWSYAAARLMHRDIRRHRAFQLDERERSAIAELRRTRAEVGSA